MGSPTTSMHLLLRSRDFPSGYGHTGICAVLLNKAMKGSCNSSHCYFNKYQFIKVPFSPHLQIFCLKIEQPCFSIIRGFTLLSKGEDSGYHFDVCSFWGRPFIVLLHGHNCNLFESSMACFRGEVKYIKDNSFSHSLNWTMVWVRQISNWFGFSVH